HLAGLSDLPVVGGVARIYCCARGTHGGAELVGNWKNQLLEFFRGSKCPTTRNDDPGGGELRAVALRKPVLDEGRKARIFACGNHFDCSRAAFARRREGGGSHRDHLLGIG